MIRKPLRNRQSTDICSASIEHPLASFSDVGTLLAVRQTNTWNSSLPGSRRGGSQRPVLSVLYRLSLGVRHQYLSDRYHEHKRSCQPSRSRFLGFPAVRRCRKRTNVNREEEVKPTFTFIVGHNTWSVCLASDLSIRKRIAIQKDIARKTHSRRMKIEGEDSLFSTVTDKVIQGLSLMRHSNVLCDFSLTCRGVEFSVHKCILAASSQYFYAMFTNGLEETRAGKVELHDVEPDALAVLLKIIYGEEVAVGDDKIEAVLSAAHMLQLDVIYDHCCQLLADNVICGNYLQVWDLADKYSSTFLQDRVIRFCAKNFRKLVQDAEFFSMSVERLACLLEREDLNVVSEDEVLEVAVAWVSADQDARQPLLYRLLSVVRFELVCRETLTAMLDTEPWIRDCVRRLGKLQSGTSPCLHRGTLKIKRNNSGNNNKTIEGSNCKVISKKESKPEDAGNVTVIINNSINGSGGTVNNNTIINNGNSATRKPAPKPSEALLVVFGENRESDVIMQCYSFTQEKWYPARGLPVPISKMGVVSYHNLVYLIGGFDGNKYLNTVFVFDITSGRFKCATSMKHKRCDVGVVLLDGLIYAVGGYDGQSYLRQVECYDPQSNTWKCVAPLSQGRAGVAAAALNGMLFVIGGYDGKSKAERRVMEYYNPALDTWTKVVDMDFGLWNAGVGVLDGYLYSVGGYKLNGDGKPCPSPAVMCFSSRDQTWKTIHKLPVDAVHTSVLTWDNCLYVMTPQGRLFGYDPDSDNWWELTRATNINGELRGSYASAVLVQKPVLPAAS